MCIVRSICISKHFGGQQPYASLFGRRLVFAVAWETVQWREVPEDIEAPPSGTACVRIISFRLEWRLVGKTCSCFLLVLWLSLLSLLFFSSLLLLLLLLLLLPALAVLGSFCVKNHSMDHGPWSFFSSPHPDVFRLDFYFAKEIEWHWYNMGVSKNSGTPKWMVYKGKPY